MSDRKVILYIATSLDGFIATADGNLDFLSVVEKEGEDYGYNDFIKTVDTVIMGRKTYDKVLSFGIDFPHDDKKCFVYSRTKKGYDEHVEFFNGDLVSLIQTLKNSEGKNIFIDGGAELVRELMKHHLIDRFVISIIPHFLGNGIQLFKSERPEEKLKFIESKSFPSGLVQLCYEKV